MLSNKSIMIMVVVLKICLILEFDSETIHLRDSVPCTKFVEQFLLWLKI